MRSLQLHQISFQLTELSKGEAGTLNVRSFSSYRTFWVYMNLEGKFLILFSNKFWIIFHISQGAFLIYTTDLNRDYFLHQVLSSPLSDSGFKFNSCHSEIMGRTVPSYRIAAEMERGKWKIFRQRLDKKDRREFDKMFSYSRLFNSAGSNACRPQLIHPIIMSIIFEHYKQLNKIVNEVGAS